MISKRHIKLANTYGFTILETMCVLIILSGLMYTGYSLYHKILDQIYINKTVDGVRKVIDSVSQKYLSYLGTINDNRGNKFYGAVFYTFLDTKITDVGYGNLTYTTGSTGGYGIYLPQNATGNRLCSTIMQSLAKLQLGTVNIPNCRLDVTFVPMA